MTENVLEDAYAVAERFQSGGLEGYAVVQADLRRLDLTDGVLTDVQFSKVTLEHVLAVQTTCREVRFEASRLRAFNFDRALVTGSRIMNCQAHEMRLNGACLHHFQVFDTEMANASFRSARLDDCTFQSAELYGADFTGALLMHCRFSDPRMENASLNRARFERALLIDVDLRKANLHGASFKDALLVKVDLRDTNLVRADFEGATMVSCDTTGSVT
jgi:uncharacterized protein YjbI with pentapeptide repeats